jgi:hypothetical protein
MGQQGDRIDNSFVQYVIDQLEASPALLDHPGIETIEQHASVMPQLMAGFFPSFLEKEQYGYITGPFSNIPLYFSNDFKELMDEEDIEVNLNIEEEEVYSRMVSNACA